MAAQIEAMPRHSAGKRLAWKDLEHHYRKIRGIHLRWFFEEDSKRFERLSVEAAGLLLDYSKNLVVPETMELLIRLANESHLRERIDAMFLEKR
jgi:glucose-6-phosphate isomerase